MILTTATGSVAARIDPRVRACEKDQEPVWGSILKKYAMATVLNPTAGNAKVRIAPKDFLNVCQLAWLAAV